MSQQHISSKQLPTRRINKSLNRQALPLPKLTFQSSKNKEQMQTGFQRCYERKIRSHMKVIKLLKMIHVPEESEDGSLKKLHRKQISNHSSSMLKKESNKKQSTISLNFNSFSQTNFQHGQTRNSQKANPIKIIKQEVTQHNFQRSKLQKSKIRFSVRNIVKSKQNNKQIQQNRKNKIKWSSFCTSISYNLLQTDKILQKPKPSKIKIKTQRKISNFQLFNSQRYQNSLKTQQSEFIGWQQSPNSYQQVCTDENIILFY